MSSFEVDPGPLAHDNTIWERVFPGVQKKRLRALSPLIGPDAALAAARASGSLAALGWVSLVVVAMATLTQFSGGHLLFALTLVCCACWLFLLYPLNKFGRQADKLAREYVSAQLGYDVGHITGVASQDSWRRSIARMQERHERAAKRHLRE